MLSWHCEDHHGDELGHFLHGIKACWETCRQNHYQLMKLSIYYRLIWCLNRYVVFNLELGEYLRLCFLRSHVWISHWSSPAAQCLYGHHCLRGNSSPLLPPQSWWTQNIFNITFLIITRHLKKDSCNMYLMQTCWWRPTASGHRLCSRSWGSTPVLVQRCSLADRGSCRSLQRKTFSWAPLTQRVQENSIDQWYTDIHRWTENQ